MYGFGILCSNFVIFLSMHYNKLEWKNTTVWPYYVMTVTKRKHCGYYREVSMTVFCSYHIMFAVSAFVMFALFNCFAAVRV